MKFTQRTVLRTEVMFHDDMVAYAHKSRTRTSRSHAQLWQRGISHLRGVKTTGVTQCKQNEHVPHAQITDFQTCGGIHAHVAVQMMIGRIVIL